MTKLIDIKGIGPDDAELLEATGWSDVASLAKADPELVAREIKRANEMLKLSPRTPDVRAVGRWITAAANAVGVPAPALVRRTSKGSPPAAAPASPVTAAAGEPALLQVVTGPVNYEADTDVAVMLESAPLAVPIPARLLAERGIAPSEILAAPLLNRAVGDIDVRVMVEKKPARKEVADPPQKRSASSMVTVGLNDPVAAAVRRGIDTAKVRTIEDVQAEPAPVRAPSTQSAAPDDRISLIRSALPSTNRGRKPSSRFYIRGVLHDRPFRVWFGGLFALLLQVVTPLAILAAPLLILSEEQTGSFSWVPKWVIAFPIALPILGLLYAIVSAGAKCRVCAQRLYVPKGCLKNRKAHRLPLIGHIGALALHVMIFRWFNCTFCGTPIRIKK